MKEFLIDNIIWFISTPLTGIVVWFSSKRYFQSRELKSKDLQNDSSHVNVINQNLDVYQRMFKDLDEQLIKANNKINELEIELDSIHKQYRELKHKYREQNLK